MADERDSLIERVKTAEAKLTDLQSKNNVRNKHFVCVCVCVCVCSFVLQFCVVYHKKNKQGIYLLCW